MARTLNSDTDDWSLSLLAYSAVVLAICLSLGMLFYWIMQPRVFPNPGMAAYEPPPGTRLIPLPRKMDAPELAAIEPELLPHTALAQELKQPEKRAVVRKRRPAPRPDYQDPFGYERSWGHGKQEWADRSHSWF